MTTETAQKPAPRIWLTDAGTFMAEDPTTGKLLSSPSYERPAADLGIATSERDRKATDQAERQAAEQATRQAAADVIPDLEATATEAADALRVARERFAEAVAADPTLAAYGAMLAAAMTANTARYHLGAAQAEAVGRQPGSGSWVLPTLLDAIETAIGAPKAPGTAMAGSPALDGQS